MSYSRDAAAASGSISARARALVAFVAALAHVPSLRNGFVLDDASLLAENPYLRTVSGLGVLLRSELFAASGQPRVVPYYRPLSGLLYWASFQTLGAHALLQHALNVAMHVVVTLLLLAVLHANAVRPGIAVAAALLFAAHPATSEVVAYVGGRQDMLGWIVGLGAALLLSRARGFTLSALLGFAASLLGALCHEFFGSLFVPLAFLAWLRGERSSRADAAGVLAGGIVGVATLFVIRRWLELVPYETNLGGTARLVEATAAVGLRLLKDLVLPNDLAVDVTVPPTGLAVACLLATTTVLAAVVLVAFVRRRKPGAAGLAAAGASIGVLSAGLHAGVALKYGFISDRYAYALLVGVAMSAAAAVEACAAMTSRSEPSPLRAFAETWGAAVVAIALVPLTWSRDASWHDERALQLAMVADRPDDPESQFAAGMMAFSDGDLERAYPHCRAYAAARVDADKPNLCIGSWLLVHRRPAEAANYLRPYALARPGMALARRAFLTSLFASRQFDEARRTVEGWSQSFEGAPDLVEARAALASAPDRLPAPSGEGEKSAGSSAQ